MFVSVFITCNDFAAATENFTKPFRSHDYWNMVTDLQNGVESMINCRAEAPFGSILKELETSGMYWKNMSRKQAEAMLERRNVGDFLIRDSLTTDHLFTISVRCRKRVYHARTTFSRGKFSIDSEYRGKDNGYESVVEMIEYYVEKCRTGYTFTFSSSKQKKVQVQLLRPVRTSCLSLKHICRTRINQIQERVPSKKLTENLPRDLKAYFNDYPFRI